MSGNRFVGQRVQRREDARLVTGHGTYVDDVVLPGMLHAAFVRSDVARGIITSIDVEAARALDGVVAVYTGAELNGDTHESWVDFEGGPTARPFRTMAEVDIRLRSRRDRDRDAAGRGRGRCCAGPGGTAGASGSG
jgi:carbon-monoxide dehydrogenase large subunit